jgi:hypothetical protein
MKILHQSNNGRWSDSEHKLFMIGTLIYDNQWGKVINQQF